MHVRSLCATGMPRSDDDDDCKPSSSSYARQGSRADEQVSWLAAQTHYPMYVNVCKAARKAAAGGPRRRTHGRDQLW